MNNLHSIFVNNYGHPLLEGVAHEITVNYQVDQTVVIGAVLANSALAIQSAYDFEGYDGRTIPCSLMVGVEAGPTRGKNSIMSKVSSPIREFETEKRREYEAELIRYQSELEVWTVRNKSLRRRLARAMDKDEDISSLEKDLQEHRSCKPAPADKLTLIAEDATNEALARLFHPKYRSLGVMSSEGGIVIKSEAFRRPEVTSQFWSGVGPAMDTVHNGQVRLEDVRVSWLLMAQSEIWKRLIDRDGGMFMATGASARMLMFRDHNPAGWQQVQDAVHTWEHHANYSRRLKALLCEGWERSKAEVFERKKIRMTQETHRCWMEYRQWAMNLTQPGGWYERAEDHAARLAENVARIATVVHVLEDFEGGIRVDTLQFAIDLARHCSSHYMAMFVPPPELEANAAFLETKFFRLCQSLMKNEGVTWASARKLRGDCPSRLRGPNNTRERYDRTLQFLVDHNLVQVGCRDGTEYLNLSNCRNLGV